MKLLQNALKMMCIEVMSSGHQSFVGLSLLDLKNETFSRYHCHNKFRTIFDFKRFFENLKNGSMASRYSEGTGQKHWWVLRSTGKSNISFLITHLVRTKFMLYQFPIFLVRRFH